MKYIIALDGGGTKTQIAVANLEGYFIYQKLGTGSNHQSLGIQGFIKIITSLYMNALKSTQLSPNDIMHIHLGLSGADLESDYKLLNDACKTIFLDTPYTLENDAWIIMRSALKKPFGAVCISGTGTNSAAINPLGQKAILRSLGFQLGIYGGGLDIAREALHYAFRDDEQTYHKTSLKPGLLKLFNKKNMNELIDLFYPNITLDRHQFGMITELTFECASMGDEVAQMILIKIGRFLGEQTAGVIKQVHMCHMKVPVVIGGKVFMGQSPLLKDEMLTNLHKTCPKAYVIQPKFLPVIGAYFRALDHLDLIQTPHMEKQIKESWKSL